MKTGKEMADEHGFVIREGLPESSAVISHDDKTVTFTLIFDEDGAACEFFQEIEKAGKGGAGCMLHLRKFTMAS